MYVYVYVCIYIPVCPGQVQLDLLSYSERSVTHRICGVCDSVFSFLGATQKWPTQFEYTYTSNLACYLSNFIMSGEGC